ncbi:MAG TPA: ATP-binding cassette domain-containing protein [Bacteroidota bacterium]
MSSEIVLQTFNLGKRYRHRWAVREANLVVHRGEIFGFLGPNGAGKSTTIRMLLTLIRPTTGRVEFFRKNVLTHRAEVLSRLGGLVERADFYLYLSGRRNLESIASLSGNVSKKEIDEVLHLVGLTKRAKDKVKTYSHGMKQRLGIAQALLRQPEFIVLDEPTTGLDPQGIKEVRELIGRLSAERGITVFLSSHLLSEIEQVATNMAIIHRGEIIVQGKVGKLLNDGDMVVRLMARPRKYTERVLSQLSFVKKVVVQGDELQVTIGTTDSSLLSSMLMKSGIEVATITPLRSLEQYFLSITEGVSDVD